MPKKTNQKIDSNAARRSKTRENLNTELEKQLLDKINSKFKLIDYIKKSPYYGKRGNDERSRIFINEHLGKSKTRKILPGQLIGFDYFTPKTKEELEYYDAQPMTIFFNNIHTELGPRVLGFNIHYYPPQIRFKIMDKIFEIYRPVYTKYFTDGPSNEVDAFDYKYLMDSLKKVGLDFGVRMYDPKLIKNIYKIPPKLWQVAVFTEGNFKKETRSTILQFWKKWAAKHK